MTQGICGAACSCIGLLSLRRPCDSAHHRRDLRDCFRHCLATQVGLIEERHTPTDRHPVTQVGAEYVHWRPALTELHITSPPSRHQSFLEPTQSWVYSDPCWRHICAHRHLVTQVGLMVNPVTSSQQPNALRIPPLTAQRPG